MANVFIWMCALASLCFCDCYKVLLIFPLPGKSHSILGDGYARLLTEAGHEVTYITPFPKKNVPPNLHQVDLSEARVTNSLDNLCNISAVLNKDTNLKDESKFFDIFANVSTQVMVNKQIVKMLNDPNQHFDIVVAEWMFLEIYAGFAAFYNAPLIWCSSVDPHAVILSLLGEDANPAYVPDIRSANTVPFTFKQRVEELFSWILLKSARNLYYTEIEKGNYKTFFGPYFERSGRELPSFDEIRYNASLVLGNSHVSLGQATTFPQSYKAIGGYHIDSDVKALPKDLEKLMNEAKHGVIYFSMGSTLKSRDFPKSLKLSILKMFGGLKQTVLWKFEESLSDLPNNVHILQWAPQQSIIAHPNCLLFITHGGLLSTTEAVHFGKPIIGIPVFGDQFVNVARSVKKGFARKVDLSFDMADELQIAINDVLSDSKYSTKAKELSFIYHHRLATPGKELVHWVEHVVETRGALHLRSPAFFVPWYQKMYIDLAALIVLLICATYKAFRKMFTKKISKQKKNN